MTVATYIFLSVTRNLQYLTKHDYIFPIGLFQIAYVIQVMRSHMPICMTNWIAIAGNEMNRSRLNLIAES